MNSGDTILRASDINHHFGLGTFQYPNRSNQAFYFTSSMTGSPNEFRTQYVQLAHVWCKNGHGVHWNSSVCHGIHEFTQDGSFKIIPGWFATVVYQLTEKKVEEHGILFHYYSIA